MSSSNISLPEDLRGFMGRIIELEFIIRASNGDRSVGTTVSAAEVYTGVLNWVLESCKTVENSSTLPPAQWRASFSARSEPDDIPTPDELQAYINQVIGVINEEVRLRAKYKIADLSTGEMKRVKHIKDVFVLIMTKLNMLGRLKWVNGGTGTMTQLMANVITLMTGPGVNANDLVPTYKTQEEALEHANQVIDEIMAEDANK
ncbi:uncharacterized protein TRUGW13939_00784 [Talaromyces rugulosus]|uniref:Uncharacterized protein n=1 Tax=Talaromyces rugulosus TaxID=121627 RepID=A0A7H8QI78_TALRU|nr:uncharacterized protein TRUGW13939_00784 [Talaromyces rugulosus]QKX53704.1 hypothetical protein TRUGW13939_00784 [Talaromyces rugulosus]